MGKKHLLTPLLLTATLSGCATLTPDAEKVMVHSQISNVLDDCTQLGPISADGFDYSFAEAKARELAASKYNADTIAIINTDDHIYYETVQAIAYNCFK